MTTQEKIDNFWREYIAVGKEVLDAGKEIGFGMSLIEVKFQEGLPSVVIRSVTKNNKYKDHAEAEISVGKLLEEIKKQNFDGAMTITMVAHQGNINRLLLDEYSNHLLV